MLPPALLQDPERRTGFEREARLLTSVSHPNSAAIHGIEDASVPGGSSPTQLGVIMWMRCLSDFTSREVAGSAGTHARLTTAR